MFQKIQQWKTKREIQNKVRLSPFLFLKKIKLIQTELNHHSLNDDDLLKHLKEILFYLHKKRFFYSEPAPKEQIHFYHQSDFLPLSKNQSLSSNPSLVIDIKQWPVLNIIIAPELDSLLNHDNLIHEEHHLILSLQENDVFDSIVKAVQIYWQLRQQVSIQQQTQKLNSFLAMAENKT